MVWSLTLPAVCLWQEVTAPKGLGDFFVWFTSTYYFAPWVMIVITLFVLAWVTEERR